jgi:drug/metabolite transporter (DMT)-like permease
VARTFSTPEQIINGLGEAGVVLAIVTPLAWVYAVSKGELSRLYSFMALSHVFVALLSQLLFNEGVTTA